MSPPYAQLLNKLRIPYLVQGHGIDVSAALRKPEVAAAVRKPTSPRRLCLREASFTVRD